MRPRGKHLWLPPVISIGLHGIVLAAAMSLMSRGDGDRAVEAVDEGVSFEISKKVKVRPRPQPPKSLPATFAPAVAAPPIKRPEFEPLKPMLPDPPKNIIVAASSTASVLFEQEKAKQSPPAPKVPAQNKTMNSPPKPPAARSSQPDSPPAAGRSSGYLSLRTVNYIRRGKAAYPSEALRRKQAGTVRLLLYINEQGTVDKAEIVQSSGFASLDAAAMVAERRSTFKPAIINGSPVKSKVIVPYTFQLK